MNRLSLLLSLAFVLSTSSVAQVATGNSYKFGAFDNKNPETVNLGNLNIHLGIPVFAKAGRGGMDFSYSLAYDSSVWTPLATSGSTTWSPSPTWGWTADTSPVSGYITFSQQYIWCTATSAWATVQYSFVYTDGFGATHAFPWGSTADTVSDCAALGSLNLSLLAADGSGITFKSTGLSTFTILMANGRIITPPLNTTGGSAGIVDANGNEITAGSGVFTDSYGTSVITVSGGGSASSPLVLTYPTFAAAGSTGSTAYATMHYVSANVMTNFGCSGITEYSASSVSLVDYVQLADGQKYQFTYEATPGHSGYVTGRIASMTLPTGGAIQYSYSGGSNGIVCKDGGAAALTRTMPNDPAGSSSWTYARTPGTNSSSTAVTDGLTNAVRYDFVNDPTDAMLTPYVINHKVYQGAASGTPLLAEQSCYNGVSPDCTGQSLTLPINSVSLTTVLSGVQTKQSVVTLNSHGFFTEDKEYEFGPYSPGWELYDTNYTYASLGAIFDHVGSVTVADMRTGTPYVLQSVTYGYDAGTASATTGLPQHTTVSGSRGNLTSVTYDTVLGGSSITTNQYTYDDAGQVLSSKDTHLNTTVYSYPYGGTNRQVDITMPTTGSTSHTMTEYYDMVTGEQYAVSDQNSNITWHGYDNLHRLHWTSYPDGGGTTYTYSLAATSPYISAVTIHATGGSNTTSTAYLDPYGRNKRLDNSDTSDDHVDYSYDADGNLGSISNPYRSGGSVNYATATYDALGRTLTVTDSDGASTSQNTYLNNHVVTQDEQGKVRQLDWDAMGRLASVYEPDASNVLSLSTEYFYNNNFSAGSGSTVSTYQNLVIQKGSSTNSADWRWRTSTLDMLGRTLSETTPEAGTLTFTYPTGSGSCVGSRTLACSRTDSNGTVSTYAYDALNRLTGKIYSGSSIGTSTPAVSYYYDQASYNGLTIANGIGTRTGMSDGSGSTAWSFDGMGRIAAIRKTINSVTKQAGYIYNADGTVNTVQDFGGTTFSYSYDVAGRPISIVDGSSNTYASSAAYNAAGQLTSLNHQLTSSGAAYGRSISYNNRLQPTSIAATVNGTTFQSLSYGYGYSWVNNGNVFSITNGMDSNRSQTFTYDTLNRLSSANDVTHWGENYTYDNWGNLIQTAQMTGLGGNNWSVTANSNNRLSNLTYDAVGQVTQDQFSNTFSYDAEGRILTGGTGTYVYDGDGNRVKKTATSTTTLYWPGVLGILDESNGSGSTMGKQVRFAGMLVWHENTSGTGKFLFQDHLNSTRITGGASGGLSDDNDYLPFGTLYNNYGSSPSDNHYLFTGDESDLSESNTDYAKFRSLSPTLGRFNRPDPYDGSYDLTNPQSLNRYSYALNRPLMSVDPIGLDDCTYPVAGQEAEDTCDNDADFGEGFQGDYGTDPGTSTSSLLPTPQGSCPAGQFPDQYGECYSVVPGLGGNAVLVGGGQTYDFNDGMGFDFPIMYGPLVPPSSGVWSSSTSGGGGSTQSSGNYNSVLSPNYKKQTCGSSLSTFGVGLIGTVLNTGAFVAAIYLGPEEFAGFEGLLNITHLGPILAPGPTIAALSAPGVIKNCF